MSNELLVMNFVTIFSALLDSMKKLYDAANDQQNDPEQTYISLSRCVQVFCKFRELCPDFEKDKKYYINMYGQTFRDATNRMETLSQQLGKM